MIEEKIQIGINTRDCYIYATENILSHFLIIETRHTLYVSQFVKVTTVGLSLGSKIFFNFIQFNILYVENHH